MIQTEKIITSSGKRFLLAAEASDNAADYQKYENLRNFIWDDPSDHFSGIRNMAGENFFHDGSSLFIGIFAEENGNFPRTEEHLTAFAYGYVGVKDREVAYRERENLVFYSQYAAVHPEFQRYNLGIQLKYFQRDIVRELLGVDFITCTYDPLVGINAYRNIHILGMDILSYKDSYYMDFGGSLNRIDIPSDRFFVSWDLKQEKYLPQYDLIKMLHAGPAIIISELVEITGESGTMQLPIPVRREFSPAPGTLPGELVLLEIPYDFYDLLRITDVPAENIRAVPLNWRMETRAAFHLLFDLGYKIVDFRYQKIENRKRDFYILAAPT